MTEKNSSTWTSSFDARAFRNALGAYATGIAIVTTVSEDGERIGLTVNSFSSLSLDPPLILFSIANNAASFPIWAKAKRFVVNVLAEEQQELSSRFGRTSADKWAGLKVEAVEGGVLFPGALMALNCAVHERVPGGDHQIVIGRVLAIAIKPTPYPNPLLYFAGRYQLIASSDRAAACPAHLFW